MISYLDREVTQGTPVTYRVKVTDTKSNLRQGDAITATPNGGAVLSAYEKAVLKDNPLHYWPLNEAAGGSTATDISGAENGTVGTSVTPGAPGAITGDPGTAYRYNGLDSASTVSTQTQRVGMKIFSLEAWFKTTTTTGGKIIGWGTKSSGNSGNSDRMIYMGRTGKVYFGVYPLAYKTVNSTAAYNNGAWHHAVATLGPDGMQLYVDGALVGSDPNTRAAQVNSGYWRVGGDYMSNWPDNPPLTSYFAGDIDNAAVYNYPLAASQVSAHAAVPANAAPTASFTAATNDLTVAVDAAASGDADGYLASYAWTFGDGGTASGRTASHTYADSGKLLGDAHGDRRERRHRNHHPHGRHAESEHPADRQLQLRRIGVGLVLRRKRPRQTRTARSRRTRGTSATGPPAAARPSTTPSWWPARTPSP